MKLYAQFEQKKWISHITHKRINNPGFNQESVKYLSRDSSRNFYYIFYLFGDLKYNLRYSETLIYVSRSWFLKASNAKYIFSSQDF